jgi:hypothetical protein
MTYEVNYSNGDNKIRMVLADDTNLEEVIDAMADLFEKPKKKAADVKEDVAAEPQILME